MSEENRTLPAAYKSVIDKIAAIANSSDEEFAKTNMEELIALSMQITASMDKQAEEIAQYAATRPLNGRVKRLNLQRMQFLL